MFHFFLGLLFCSFAGVAGDRSVLNHFSLQSPSSLDQEGLLADRVAHCAPFEHVSCYRYG
jgi:hypothetical protein